MTISQDTEILDQDQAFEAMADTLLEVIDRDAAGHWRMPWTGVAAFPTNAFSGRRFKSSNVTTLWAAAKKGGFTTHLWAPPTQWEKKGGCLRPGAAGAVILVPQFAEDGPVTKWTRKTPGIEKKIGPLGGDAEGGESKAFLGFKKERWFNIHETEGVNIAPPVPPVPSEAAAAMEKALLTWFAPKGKGPAVATGGIRACWAPDRDRITMPPKNAFQPRDDVSGYAYYVQTLGHETIHSSGSKGRLKRDMAGSFGSVKYAKEELVAELGTTFLCAHFGLPAQLLDHSAAYVQSWMSTMKDKTRRKNFFWAAKQAEQAARFVLAHAGIRMD